MSVQKDPSGPENSGELHRCVEATLGENEPDADALSAQQVRDLVHELGVRQIELELRNKKLHEAQKELETTRDRYADLYDFAPIGYLTVSGNGQILEANLTAATLLGIEKGDLDKEKWLLSDFVAREQQSVYQEHRSAVLRAKSAQTCELNMVARDGKPFYVRMQSVGVAKHDGAVAKWRTVISDITDQRRAKEALRASERNFRSLFDEALDMIHIVDRGGRLTDINPTELAILGYSREECIGRPLVEIIHPDYRERTAKALKRVFEGHKIHLYETAFVTRKGDTIMVEVSAFPQGLNGEILAACAICRDITERKRISMNLARTLEQQDGLNLILRAVQATHTPVQVLEVAMDHVLQISWLGIQASGAAFLLRGQQLHKVVSRNLPPAVDQGCAQIPLGQCLCGRVAQTGEPIICAHWNECVAEHDAWRFHAVGVQDHGHVILPLKWQSQILGVLCFYVSAGDEFNDHRSEFLKAVASIAATAIGRLTYQSQLAQSERLSTVGLLAAGVAHEIKNPLALALTNVEWLAEDLPPILEQSRILRQRVTDEFPAERAGTLLSDLPDLGNAELLQDIAECAQSALDGVHRVRSIVRDLVTFSRADEDELSRLSLADVLERALNLAYSEIKYRARVTRDFSQTPHVLANEGRLSQVFLNLLINAAHAIDKGHPEDNEIRVRLWHEGQEALVEVQDTGKGIDPADLPYLFDPFFTTKDQGVGTGLGLYISNNIVASLGGRIDVESTVGAGTRFVIRLPVAEPEAPTGSEDERR